MKLLSARNVTHYFGGLCSVSKFSLELEPYELIGIIGPNGAGKTTVFNLMTGIHRSTQGSIVLDGEEIVGKSPASITEMGVARTFQNIRLFNELTVLDNIRIAHYSRIKYRALEAVMHIGRFRSEEKRVIDHSLELLSMFKMADLAKETSRNLPYGMQRRLEIVRALATSPKLLLLDEPAAGMNPREIDALMDFITSIRRQFRLTIIVIEHQMRLIMAICERILVLNFGTTIAEGTPEQIRSNPKVLEAYLGKIAG